MSKILLSTRSELILLDIETEEKKVVYKFYEDNNREASLVFGFDWFDNRLFIALSFQNQSSICEIKDGDIIREYSPPSHLGLIKHPHQILFINDSLLITSTLNNKIYRLNIKDNTWDIYYNKEGEKKNYWINSIRYKDNNIYILHHNKSDSFLYEYQYNDLELKRSWAIGEKSHNSWDMDGTIWYCDSGNGKISGLNNKSVLVGGFPRGVGLSDKKLVVGISKIRKGDDVVGLNGGLTGVLVLNRFGLKKEKMIDFGKSEIFDIKFVDKFDFINNKKQLNYHF